jgi:pyruvate/2-oxoglutarate dehydrogenase complex dihydrolipoamide dehydrogenase (E3) component
MAGWLKAYDYDLVVIGAGSAGVWASQYAARLGARVALVEQLRIGGDCTHYGCVPSKALLKAAGVAWAVRSAAQFGLAAPGPAPEVNLERIMASVREAIERVYTLETPDSLGRTGVDVAMGAARFLDPHTLLVGQDTHVRARRVLVCTGARSTLPSIEGLENIDYWTYETIWNQTRLPRHLLVLGSGPVGTELSQAFARLGSRVTVFERGDRPLRIADRGEPVDGDALLVAVGRRPTVEGLNLERAGVKYSERGIQVNDQLRTTQDHIYACGDVIGGFQFTHYAAWQASVAVRNILFPGSSGGVRAHVPWTVFTDPEVAHCGLSELEARQRLPTSEPVRVVSWSLDHVDRAVTDRSFNGFIKVITRADGTIVGADIVSPRAGETVHEFALAMDHRLKLGELSSTMHVYPTYAVGVQQLAADERVRGVQQSRWIKLLRQVGRLGRR